MQTIYAGKYKNTLESTNFHWVGMKMSETGEYLIDFQILHVFFYWYTVSASCSHSLLSIILYNYWKGMGGKMVV